MIIIEQTHFFLINKILMAIYLSGTFVVVMYKILINHFNLIFRTRRSSHTMGKLKIEFAFHGSKIIRCILLSVGALVLVLVLFLSCSSDTPFEAPAPSDQLTMFSNIQTQVFDQSCSKSGCHLGANPAANLDLSSGNSYNNLVNIQSSEIPSLLRVKPGDTDSSYLLLKLIGDPGIVGSRMPRGAPPLSNPTIDSIAKWIQEGALNN
jgi:hypothetical protein